MDEVSHRGNNSVETADIEATIDDSSMKLKESPNSQGFIAKIGNVRCYWHRANGVPRIVIGPEWFYSFAIQQFFSLFQANGKKEFLNLGDEYGGIQYFR